MCEKIEGGSQEKGGETCEPDTPPVWGALAVRMLCCLAGHSRSLDTVVRLRHGVSIFRSGNRKHEKYYSLL
jgi:hypothetical protein